eukprot:gene7223-14732_t
MADISYWCDEYSKHLDEFEKLIESAKKSIGETKSAAIESCETEIARLKDVKKSFGLELRLLKDKTLKVQFDVKSKENDMRLTDLTNEFQQVKQTADKNELTQGAKRTVLTTEGKGNEELLLGAATIQEKTLESLDRTKGLIEQSKEVGAATIEVLRQQREQINDIDVEISGINDNLKKAEKLITNFARRVATDRLIQILTTLNIMVLIAVIVYVIYTKNGLGSTSTSSDYSPSTGSVPTFSPTLRPAT